MITLNEIYESIKNKFFNKTSIDVERGTTIDYYLLASSDMLLEAYKEIENNRTPHIYSSLKGEQLDDLAILVGLTRRADESDKNFLYRILSWNISNKASNTTAIETALMDMEYCSNVTYVPHAFGCGTAAAYIIPKVMDDENKALAIAETKQRLRNVTSPSTHIEYLIPTIREVKLKLLINADAADVGAIKDNIESAILEYINGIAPGDYLEIGEINKIGTNEPNVKYFNVAALLINNKEIGAISILQKVESKLIISEEDIIWAEVE